MRSVPRVLAGGAVVGVLAGLATPVVSTSCVGRECDSSYLTYGLADAGEMIGPTTWESNAIDQPWLPFPGNRTYGFSLYYADGGSVLMEARTMRAFVSPDPNPNQNGASNWTEIVGNDAEWSNDGPGTDAGPAHITLTNNTCANWYLRVELELYPCDAGCDAATSATDGGGDAVTDAVTDVVTDAGNDGG